MRPVTARIAAATWCLTTVAITVAAPTSAVPADDDAWVEFEGGRGPAIGAAAGTGDRPGSIARPASFSPRLENPGDVTGGGEGGEVECPWVPVGPYAEVAAAQAAINAQQMPNVQNPSVPGAIALVPGMIQGTAVTDWYRVTGTTAEVYHRQVCGGRTVGLRWLPLVPDGSGNLVVQVRARDLVPGARDEVIRRLPTPIPRIGPADEDSHGWTYVNMRTFFWVDQTPDQWHPVTATASAGGISVTVTAEPIRLRIDPGDGSAPVVCDGAPRPVTRANHHEGIDGCTHTYVDSSAMAPNGETWPVSVAIVWHATWTATTGEGGDLGYVATTSATRDLPVAEIQAVITRTDN